MNCSRPAKCHKLFQGLFLFFASAEEIFSEEKQFLLRLFQAFHSANQLLSLLVCYAEAASRSETLNSTGFL